MPIIYRVNSQKNHLQMILGKLVERMDKCQIRKNKARAGFTLTEMLTVVAILAILIAVAVPGVSAVQRNMKMMELDNAAKSIFVAAQNRMSELRASGTLKVTVNASGDYESSLGGTQMTAAPGDFPSGATWQANRYFYLSQSDTAALATLLPAGSIETILNDGCFYIEYDAKTGMVYGVFYAETGFTYDTTSLSRADRDARRNYDPMLGYYGGAEVDYSDISSVPNPFFAIVNEEKLYVTFTYDDACVYTLEINDGVNTVSFDVTNPPNLLIVEQDTVAKQYKVVLDSLELSKHFKENFSGLTPGADITVSLTVSGTNKIPLTVSETENSLFASVDSSGVANIAYGRHLQNLAPAVSVDTAATSVSGITAASLIAAIDWQYWIDEANLAFAPIANGTGTYSTQDRYGIFAGALSPIDGYTAGYIKAFNGNGNTISNLNEALFNGFIGDSSNRYTITNVKLVNSKIEVTATNRYTVGALVCSAKYVAISGCGVYAEGTSFTAYTCYITHGQQNGTTSRTPAYTGGLIGLADNCTVEKSFAAMTRVASNMSASGGSHSVGGLVGGIYSTNISHSYAATGYWDSTAFEWNVNSGVIADLGRAGGLMGFGQSGTISYCYSQGNVKTEQGTAYSTSAGLVGQISVYGGIKIGSCYTGCTYDGGTATTTFKYGIYSYPTASDTISTSYWVSGSWNYFATSSSLSTAGQTAPGGVSSNDLAKVFSGAAMKVYYPAGTLIDHTTPTLTDFVAASAATTNGYGQTGAYQFPRLAGMRHYGDWAPVRAEVDELTITNGEELTLAITGNSGNSYAIEVTDGTKTYVYKLSNTGVITDSTVPSHTSLSGMVANTDTSTAGKTTYTIILDSLTSGLQFKTLFSALTPGANITVTVVASESGALDSLPKDATDNSLFVYDGSGNPGTIATAEIALGRHLQNLAPDVSGVGSASGVTTAMLIADIDWSAYWNDGTTYSLTFEPITNGTYDNSGTTATTPTKLVKATNGYIKEFNGSGYTIKNLSQPLFNGFIRDASSRGAITDVRLVNSKIDIKATDGYYYAGALVCAANYVDISGCGVYAEADSSGSFNINSCYIVHPMNTKGGSNGSGYDSCVGGLIGFADSCDIQYSFAAMTRVVAGYRQPPQGGVHYAGGLVGGSFYTSIKYSYANTGYWDTSTQGWDLDSGVLAEGGGVTGGLAGRAYGGEIYYCYNQGRVMTAGWYTVTKTAMNGFIGLADASKGFTIGHCYAATSSFEGAASYTSFPYGITLNIANFSTFSTAPNYFLTGVFPAARAAAAAIKGMGGVDVANLKKVFTGDTITAYTANSVLNTAHVTPDLSGIFVTAAASHGYGLAGKSYPYPHLAGVPHYGDWYQEPINAALAYYEAYADGTYGFYSDTSDAFSSGIAALDDNKTVVKDGYAILTNSTSLTVTQDSSSVTLTQVAAQDGSAVTYGGYYVYDIGVGDSGSPTYDIAAPAAFYKKLVISEYGTTVATTYYNAAFAKTAVNNATSAPTAPSTIILRTARHLSRLSENSEYWDSIFVQERDIDFGAYTGDPNLRLSSIGRVDGVVFTGSYDGRDYVIRVGQDALNTGFGGLFGKIGELSGTKIVGEVSNVAFISDTGDVEILAANNAYVGAFVGQNLGTIQNCFAAGFVITGQGAYSVIGGFVGSNLNKGVIKSCGASNTLSGIGSMVGGFAGGNPGTISYCYAVAKLSVTSTKSCGGFVGTCYSTGPISYSYCVTRDISGTGTWKTFYGSVSLNATPNLSGCVSYDGINHDDIKAFAASYPSSFGFPTLTFPYAPDLIGSNYPYPSSVTKNGVYVHYGD